MSRKYICDNCGAEFDKLWVVTKEEPCCDVGDYNLWKVFFRPAIKDKIQGYAIIEICKLCKEKLQKLIKDGF